MWESFKKAWNKVKAGTLAVAAWMREVSATGDVDRANTKFTRTYDQKMIEYNAGYRLGRTAARVVRSVSSAFNNVSDVVDNIISDAPALPDRAQAERKEKQADRHIKMEQKKNKYNIVKKSTRLEQKPASSWKEKDNRTSLEPASTERK